MIENKIQREYFEWMYDLVIDDRYSKASYRKLLEHLNERDFKVILEMDENRAEDGTDLRYRFGRERGYSTHDIEQFLDIYQCSILEMMIALACRCEDQIMEDDAQGNRTGIWFWNMIVSLGLGQMNDERYSEKRVDFIIDRFLDREYDANGRGGLFTIQNRYIDMRETEIWYQMSYYLDEFLT